MRTIVHLFAPTRFWPNRAACRLKVGSNWELTDDPMKVTCMQCRCTTRFKCEADKKVRS